jgi:ParB family chromosome partitioning protein
MSADGKRRSLGRGLAALLGEEAEEAPARDDARMVRTVPVGALKPGRFQPRRVFDDESLKPLADSVRERGVLQPILVRRLPEDPNRFEIIAGERRWRAAQMAQRHEVPIIEREIGDREMLEVALVENIQRQDLTAIEEAEGYQRLMVEFGHTQEALATAVGKSRSHIANTLRLLDLPEAVKVMVNQGLLSAGHARALIGAADPAGLAADVVRLGLNVRQTEALAQAAKPARKNSAAAKPAKDADTAAIERDLTSRLGLKVTIDHAAKGGALTIRYRTLEQLDGVLLLLNEGGAPRR